MQTEIDPLLKTILIPVDEVLDSVTSEPEAPLEKFLEDLRFGPIDQGTAPLAKASTEWAEEISAASDGDSLENNYSAVRKTNRRVTLEKFVRTSLAAGETISGLVDHAKRYDGATAREIQEIGDQLAA